MRSVARPKIAFVRTRLGVGTSINQPLHFLYIAAALEDELGARCRIIDCEPLGLDDDEVLDALADDPPDAIGFTAMTVDLPAVLRLSNRVRQRFRARGALVRRKPPITPSRRQDLRALPAIDVVIKGEGERTSVDLARALGDGTREPAGIAGTSYRAADGQIHHNPDRPSRGSISTGCTMPACAHSSTSPLTTVGFGEWACSISGPRTLMSLFTSRACPYGDATYCHATFGKEGSKPTAPSASSPRCRRC